MHHRTAPASRDAPARNRKDKMSQTPSRSDAAPQAKAPASASASPLADGPDGAEAASHAAAGETAPRSQPTGPAGESPEAETAPDTGADTGARAGKTPRSADDAARNVASHTTPDTENDTSTAGLGFFGRIIAALSSNEAEAEATLTGNGRSVGIAAPGMLNLRRMRVEDVLIPKADIVAVPLTLDRDDLVELFRSTGMSRIPVFDGTLDNPTGFVNLKDFALRHGFGDDGAFDLAALVRPLLYVPPSMPLGILLQKMQSERTHMALVIDEYGGTDGLVTIEDLIEQVVGEIEDEHDVDEVAGIVVEKPGVWLALAKASLEEVEEAMGVNLTDVEEVDEEDVDTLGGLVIMLAGHVPARGEVIRHPNGPEFEVMEADPRRIKRLRVRLEPAAKVTAKTVVGE